MTDADQESARPRRRRRRKEARPAEIIEAGLQEFAEHGFAAAKLDDVARRAEIAKGTIYLYFKNKEALFEAAVRSQIVPFFGSVEQMADAYPGSSADLLRTIIPQIYATVFGSDRQVLIRIILTEGARFPELSEFYHREVISKGRRLLERIIRRGVERGEFHDNAVADLPIILVAPAILAFVWKMILDRFDPIATERFAAAHADLVLEGLMKAPASGGDAGPSDGR